MDERPLLHICEVCGRTETLTAAEAFEAGWDYPPKIGAFGVVSPRTCPDCPVSATVWAALMVEGKAASDLTAEQLAVVARVEGEPESLWPPS